MTPSQSIGLALLRERERQGLTTVQLAKASGLSDRTIRRAEVGGSLDARTLRRVVTALGVRMRVTLEPLPSTA